MTLHYPDSDAAPTGAPPRDTLGTSYSTAAEPAYGTTEETIVPVYARKPAKRRGGVPKAALIAIPVVLALGVGGWALMAGQSSRDAAQTADTDSLTTSRLDVTQPTSPEVAAPAVTEAPTPVPVPAAAPAPAVTPAPVARSTRSSAPAARRVAAPARRSTAPAPAAEATVPAAPQPYNSGGLTTVITEPTAAPPSVVPTPPLPVVPTPPETPPGPTTPPGGQF